MKRLNKSDVRIEAADGLWGLFVKLNGFWLLHGSYKTRTEVLEALSLLTLRLQGDNNETAI